VNPLDEGAGDVRPARRRVPPLMRSAPRRCCRRAGRSPRSRRWARRRTDR
jgi:hypothetical protein